MSVLGLDGTDGVTVRSEQQHAERFRAFLDAHLDQEMLRFTTAGSVDDGKSTLIGRLLHDTKSVYEDQLASLRASRVNRAGNGQVDLSLLTDGLRAEREQGITIDVAYRYFSTSKRKFIIADTPGHEQYTRNMATGASTADVAIVLIDANAYVKAGSLLPQSRRHTNIASLLRIPHVVAAVNKMDLAGYDEAIFRRIEAEYRALAERLGLRDVAMVPVSALAGDNVVERTAAMPWYTGPTLLEYLETVPLGITDSRTEPLRFPVQLVVRPDATFRGFAGRVERGEVRPGMEVRALPSGRLTRVKSIVTWDGELKAASSPQGVTLELEDEIDLSRGEMLIEAAGETPTVSSRFAAQVVWMSEEPLQPGKTYLLKHTTRTVRGTVRAIRFRTNVSSAESGPASELGMNDIGEIELETALPLFFDPYAVNRALGSLILIDPLSNATVGAAMLVAAIGHAETPVAAVGDRVRSEAATQLARDGFCVLKGVFSAADVEAARLAFEPRLTAYLGAHAEQGNRGPHRHFFPAPFERPIFSEAFFFNSRVLAVVSELLGERVVADQWECDVPVRGSEYQEAHVDYQRPLFPELPQLQLPPYMLVMSFGLSRIGSDDGPVEIAPGTHSLLREEAQLAVSSGRLPMQPVTLEVGDVLLRHPWALHRGSPNRTETPRALMTVRYVRSWYEDRSREVHAVPRAVWNTLSAEQQQRMGFQVEA